MEGNVADNDNFRVFRPFYQCLFVFVAVVVEHDLMTCVFQGLALLHDLIFADAQRLDKYNLHTSFYRVVVYQLHFYKGSKIKQKVATCFGLFRFIKKMSSKDKKVN